MMRIVLVTAVLGLIVIVSLASGASAQELSDSQIMRLGLTARLEPAQRDQSVQRIADLIRRAAAEGDLAVARHEQAFSQALLLVCDRGVIETLSWETVEAVDEAIESVLSERDILRGRYGSLAYVYGFFNHDATAEQITRAAQAWRQMPEDRKRSLYPTYPHLIDALTKPLSVGPVGDDAATRAALDAAIPVLWEAVTSPPAPGTVFHPPTHAVLVLAPIYDRWADDAAHGEIVRSRLGNRQQFISMVAGQLAGARPAPADLSAMELTYYEYTGRYLANALARLGAVEARDTLRASLAIYESMGRGGAAAVSYTRRALIALDDAELRAGLEADPASPGSRETLVWLARNGTDEAASFARRLLAGVYGVEPDGALDRYFRERLAAVSDDGAD